MRRKQRPGGETNEEVFRYVEPSSESRLSSRLESARGRSESIAIFPKTVPLVRPFIPVAAPFASRQPPIPGPAAANVCSSKQFFKNAFGVLRSRAFLCSPRQKTRRKTTSLLAGWKRCVALACNGCTCRYSGNRSADTTTSVYFCLAEK